MTLADSPATPAALVTTDWAREHLDDDRVRFLAARNRMQTLARNAPLPVVWSQLRSAADRPPSGMTAPILKRVSLGLAERRQLSRGWAASPREVWAAWAGKDEQVSSRSPASRPR